MVADHEHQQSFCHEHSVQGSPPYKALPALEARALTRPIRHGQTVPKRAWCQQPQSNPALRVRTQEQASRKHTCASGQAGTRHSAWQASMQDGHVCPRPLAPAPGDQAGLEKITSVRDSSSHS